MRNALFILAIVCCVTFYAQAKTGTSLLRLGVNNWGASSQQFKEQGYALDKEDRLVRLESKAFDRPSVLPYSSKISALSRRQNAKGQQGYQTATFFEDRLVRFKQTVVFSPDQFRRIKSTILAFERQLIGDASVMTEAANEKRDSQYQYQQGEHLYIIKLLFDQQSEGGVLQIESRWSRMDTTLRQYERHLSSLPARQ